MGWRVRGKERKERMEKERAVERETKRRRKRDSAP